MQPNNALPGGTLSCKQVIEALTFYADGELHAADSARLEKHLESCAACAVAWRNTQLAERALIEAAAAIPVAGDLKAGFTARLIPAPRHSRTLPRFTLAPVGIAFVAGMAWLLWPRADHTQEKTQRVAVAVQSPAANAEHIRSSKSVPHVRRIEHASVGVTSISHSPVIHRLRDGNNTQPILRREIQLAMNVPAVHESAGLPHAGVVHKPGHTTAHKNSVAQPIVPHQQGGAMVAMNIPHNVAGQLPGELTQSTTVPVAKHIAIAAATVQPATSNRASRILFTTQPGGQSALKTSGIDIHVVDPTRHLNARLVLPATVQRHGAAATSSNIEPGGELR